MPGSTYSTNLKVELMATGENSGTWGDITNTNLGTALEQAIVGYGNPDYASDANLTISITNSNAAQAARALVLNVTSSLSLTATRELVVPTIQKQYIVQNNTTGSQSITVKTSAGTGITVPNGRKAHLYVNGTDVIQMFDFVDINGGAIDGTPIGASSASTGAFTTLNASGATTLDGNVTLGNASGDNVTVTGTITSNLLFTDNTYDIGASGATRPRNLFLAGAATIGGNLSVGGTLTLTGGVNLNGNVTVGDNATDTLTINSTITSNLIFTDNTYDIGASGATRPRNLFLAGNATIGGNQTLTGALTVDSTTDSSSTTTGSIQTDGGLGVAKALYVGTNVNIGGLTASKGVFTDASKNLTSTGTLGTDQGGTGLTSFTANGLVYATSTSALTTGSALTYVAETLTVNTGSTGGTTGFSASNSAALGYTALTLKNTGASGKTYEVGVGGNGTAGNYQNNLYIRDTSGNPTFYLNSAGVGVVGTASVSGTLFKSEGSFLQWNSTGLTGGTNRGIVWADSSSNLYIGTGAGNSTVATFNSTGVGIGTAPSFLFDVNGVNASGTLLAVRASAVTASQVNIGIGVLTAGRPFVGTNTSSNPLEFGTRAATDIVFVSNSSERMRLWGTGEFEIGGTFNQGRALNVDSAADGYTASLLQTDAFSSGKTSGIVFAGYYDGSSITDLASIRGGKENTTSGDYGGKLAFYTRANGGSDTERVRITSTGNVCIGSTEPGNAGVLNLSVGNPGTTVGGLQLWSTTSGTHYVQFGDSAIGGAPYSGAVGYNHSVDALTFWTNQSEKMRLTSAGYLGIGVTSPAANLDLRGSGVVSQYIISTSASSQENQLVSLCNSGAAYSSLNLDGSNIKFRISGSNKVGIDSTGLGIGTMSPVTALQVNAAAPTIRIEETTTGGSKRLEMGVTSSGIAFIGANQSAQDLVFQTVGSERARITSTGQLLVGTTSTGGSYPLQAKNAGLDGTSTALNSGVTTTIYTIPNIVTAAFVVVFADNGSSGFCDTLIFLANTNPVVLSSSTLYGAPPARTYSMASNTQLRLNVAMACTARVSVLGTS